MVLQAKRVLAANKVKALNFDGVNDHVEVPDSPSLDITDEITIIIWLKPLAAQRAWLTWKGGYWGPWLLDFKGNLGAVDGKYPLYFQIGKSTVRDSINDYIITLNEWQMITGIAKAYNYIKIGVNSKITNEKATSAGFAVTTYPLRISYWYYFKGPIGSVLIYNRALSDSEIEYIYKHPYNPILSGCVLWLSPENVDESAGVWRDKSGNGNNGTIYGAQAMDMNKLTFNVKNSNRVLEAI